MRRPHYIKHNSSSETIHSAIFVDTETDQLLVDERTIKHVLRFGMACYVRRLAKGKWSSPIWCRFETKADFWNWVEGKCRNRVKTYMFCHNTSFDLPVLDVFRELPLRGWKLKTAIIDAPPTIIKFTKDTYDITILDTLNWWRTSLKQLASKVGMRKLDMPKNIKNVVDFDRYCKRDVDIIRVAIETWCDFVQDNDFGGFAPTLASQSMRLFRHKYMKHQIAIHADENALALERDAYKGGRTECFRLGALEGVWRMLDVNSMYPYVMREHEYPIVLRHFVKHCTLEEVEKWLTKFCVIADVEVNVDAPVFAYRANGKLIFPVGKFRLSLTTEELRYGFKNGYIKRVFYVALYDKAKIFTNLVNEIYTLRLQAQDRGESVLEYQYKILLNSHYGKYGQRGIVYDTDHWDSDLSARKWIEIDAETKEVTKFRQLGGLVQRQIQEGESRDSFPAIAAHVTANARLYLWQIINIAGRDNVAYCDTDSILVNGEGVRRCLHLLDDHELGKLKREWRDKWVTLYGAKDYKTSKFQKRKGIRSNAQEISRSKYKQEQWPSLRGLLEISSLDAPLTRQVEKTLKRSYDKGLVSPCGLVTPIVLG